MDRLASGPAFGLERRRFRVSGIVQGVGFRPLIFRLALEHGVSGYVCNELGVVTLEAEAAPERLTCFHKALLAQAAPPARIDRLEEERLPPIGLAGFSIRTSAAAGASASAPVFPPDLAVCPLCRADLADPGGRFAGYPFTSCTYCGPRYSVIEDLPYDRPLTAMAAFPLCDACRADYTNPRNRRFHAQTIACPACGPHIDVRTADGQTAGRGDWQALVHQVLRAGGIAAVKGIGGFHLICDATAEAAVQRLRVRKRRPRRPLAIMARSLEVVERSFDLSHAEQEALTSASAPILLLRPRAQAAGSLPLGALAPGHRRLGVMLPYSPLHLLLFPDGMPFLVATSANGSGLPIARTNDEALTQLCGVADIFVLHDRDIVVRVEDSVCQVADETLLVVRRSRGFVPESLAIPIPPGTGNAAPPILGAGGEQANTVCLVQGGRAVLSQHHGDIAGAEHLTARHEGICHLTGLLRSDPQVVAYDPHPEYLVSQETVRRFAGRVQIPVYHHHAHMAACMAEHGLVSPVIGCILDGTGFGPDGTLWGFEILAGDYAGFERHAHLQPITLPGGEAAIRQPWLLAVSLYHDLKRDTLLTERWARQCFPEHQTKLPPVLAQLDGRITAPKASSAGRLFDATAALLGLCTVSSYEGEAAILLGELAEAAANSAAGAYPVVCEDGVFQTAPLVGSLLEDLDSARPVSVIARKFHQTVAEMVCAGAVRARERTGLRTVVLGGGVWNNRCLLSITRRLLSESGFVVYSPERVPPGDGGLALGQAVVALWRWSAHVSGGAGEGAGG
ncbi:MAG TPA: carbamoyltransferase HypF [Symbiobacteriaceae bacterium]|nr:carbamoyltransferase HypF [Symbiobacteriaceae bacterium]